MEYLAKLRRDLLINGVAASRLIPPGMRWRLYRLLGIDAQRCHVYSGAFIGVTILVIGADTFINHDAFIDGSDLVTIGRNVSVSFGVTFCTSSHDLGPSDARAGTLTSAPISVGDGAWIGARAVILSGVTIGNGCVIAAGAVVTKNCEADGVYAGVPATRVRSLLE